jgi:hypothetical protein
VDRKVVEQAFRGNVKVEEASFRNGMEIIGWVVQEKRCSYF